MGLSRYWICTKILELLLNKNSKFLDTDTTDQHGFFLVFYKNIRVVKSTSNFWFRLFRNNSIDSYLLNLVCGAKPAITSCIRPRFAHARRRSHVQILDFVRMALDESAARRHFAAHQHTEGAVSDGDILDRDLQ